MKLILKIFIIMLLIFYFIITFFPFYEGEDIRKLFCNEKVDYKTLYNANDMAGFRGDGYSLYILKIKNLKKNDIINFKKCKPILEGKKNWKTSNWCNTPFAEDHNFICSKSVNYLCGNKALEKKLKYLRERIEKNKGFYLFYSKIGKSKIDFYFFDTEELLLYAISTVG